ncbi:MAG TPA: zinc ribbon domain-containing protein [Candidatus Saccharimonadales bacterium]|nr:zinc ribbon domain-containing protein [Candidatus Saccharimonadales bacterium]
MGAADDPNLIVGGFGLGLLALAVLWRLITWVRDAPPTPDPWDAQVEQQIHQPDAQEICPHCSAPQEPGAWFCGHCGRAVGPYNNLMPFLNVFSEGEVLRNGVSDRFRSRLFVAAGYFLIVLSFISSFLMDYPLITVGVLSFVALVYWFSVWRNLKRPPKPPEPANGQEVQR